MAGAWNRRETGAMPTRDVGKAARVQILNFTGGIRDVKAAEGGCCSIHPEKTGDGVRMREMEPKS